MLEGNASRCWGWCGMGALAALGVALAFGALRRTELAPPGEIALWVADRDADRVYALDAQLILARRVTLARPVDLVRTPSGRLFVLRAGLSRASGFLDELGADGSCRRELELGTCLDLDRLGEAALLVEKTGGEGARALLLEPGSPARTLLRAPGLCCISRSLDSVLVGTRAGRIERLAPDGTRVLASAELGGGLADLAPAGESGAVFALDAPGRRLVCLGPDLARRWVADLPCESRQLGAVPGEERVWLVETDARRVLRYGPGGRQELDRDGLPLAGLQRVLAWDGGGALLVAPGAILALDSQGHLAPGQGGFNYLVALAR